MRTETEQFQDSGNKDVLITIESRQTYDGSEFENMELITRGTYNYGEDGIRFTYMESPITGMNGTKTMFQVKPGEVVMSRNGSINGRMIFRPGESNRCRYLSPYGMMQMGVDTRRLEYSLDEHGGNMEIEYDLDFEKSFMSRNTFIISVREQKKRGMKS